MPLSRSSLLFAASAMVLYAAASSRAVGQEVAGVAARPSDPFAQATSDIPADTKVRFGVLPNGMQYAIMRNATPPAQASFRLRIDAGSLMENEDQLGLAHFMEHMAFNGTTNIPENELVRLLERHGLAFGADANASTNFDQTVYMLELPRADEAIVDDALKVMREQVSEALMAPDAVEAERGVIEGEERLRNTAGFRSIKAQLALLAPGQRISQRMPIGELNIIRTAPRERFVEFYQAYYRPSRATFVAVGDFNVDEMEAKVRGAFASWQPKAADGPEPDLGALSPRESGIRILVEPGIQSNIQLSWVRAAENRPDTIVERETALLKDLAVAVLNRRLSALSRADDPPFIEASAGASDVVRSLHVASVNASFATGGWNRALASIEQERRRFITFGVSDEELRLEIAAVHTELRDAAAGAATRSSAALANAIVQAVNEDDVFADPQTRLELFDRAIQGVSAAQVNSLIEAIFQGQGPLVFLSTPVAVEGGEAAVADALQVSRQVVVAAPPPQPALAWPYGYFGSAGVVIDRHNLSEVGVTIVTFANGVRLAVKQTSFSEDRVQVQVRAGLGEQTMPRDRQSPASLSPALVIPGGLGRMSLDEMSRALPDRSYSSAFWVGENAYLLAGNTTPNDLRLQLQVLAAYVRDPGLRDQAFNQFQSVYPGLAQQALATPAGAFAFQGNALLAGGDQRVAEPSVEAVSAWTNADFRQALLSGLNIGPLSVIVVGDISVDEAVEATASTFGAFDMRALAEALPGSSRRVFPPHNETPIQLHHNGRLDQAMGFLAWPTTDAIGDRTEARRIAVLAEVLKLRVTEEIREKRGLTYSPAVTATTSSVYPEYGYISISANVNPADLNAFHQAVAQVVERLREVEISDDELSRAKNPMLATLRRNTSTNEYWIQQMPFLLEDPSNAVRQTQLHSQVIEHVTVHDIRALARRYLSPQTLWSATVTPRPNPESDDDDSTR